MRRIDELHLEHTFAGARMLLEMLKLEGHEIGRKHVGTLMKKLRTESLLCTVTTTCLPLYRHFRSIATPERSEVTFQFTALFKSMRI